MQKLLSQFTIIFLKKKGKKMRKYKVVLDHEVSSTYIVDAKDDADLLNLLKTDKLIEKAESIKKDTTKTIINNWKQIGKNNGITK